MAKYLRYRGEFLSRAGVTWRVEILQESSRPFETIGELIFESDEALVIEWSSRGKEEVICGSSATLRIESPGDRTYEDLYTIAPGRIRMDVYRNDSLYWSGALDPEFYEEPYERASNYPVALTFSDFGILGRLKYNLSGMQTLEEIIGYSLARSGINTVLDASLISTSITKDGAGMTLADIKVSSDNFYDEDGEPLTLEEVVDGILQPLALRMIQRSGQVFIYDLNALYESGRVEPVYWDGDSQTMSVDKVYSNAKITWSPYTRSEDLLPPDCYTQDVDPGVVVRFSADGMDVLWGQKGYPATVFTYPYGSDPHILNTDETAAGFSLWLSENGENVKIIDPKARYFKIVPQAEGSECDGVAINWPGFQFESPSGFGPEEAKYLIHGFREEIGGKLEVKGNPIFRSADVWIPPVKDNTVDLHVSLEVLVDPRLNFYNEAANFTLYVEKIGGSNSFIEIKHDIPIKDYKSYWEKNGNFLYIPVRILFESDHGETYCWDNRFVINTPSSVAWESIPATKGGWVKDTGDIWGYLAYYDPDEGRDKKTGVLGWKKNRQAINPHKEELSFAMKKAEGQYIPYPIGGQYGGSIRIEILAGWIGTNEKGRDYTEGLFNSNRTAWILCKAPQIELVDITASGVAYGGKGIALESEDVEYVGEINADAKEEISIDTICGTAKEGILMARGSYYDAATNRPIIELSRGKRTSQAEDLLIGTLFSQFSQRKTTLSGEMRLPENGSLSAYSESNQGDKKFLMTADVQDLIEDVGNVTITEFRPDEYIKKNS